MKIVVSTYAGSEQYIDACVRILDELWVDHPTIVVFSDRGAFDHAPRAIGTSQAWAPLMSQCLDEGIRTATISPDESVVLLLEDHVPHAPVDGKLIAGLDRFLLDNGGTYINLGGHGPGRLVASVDDCPVHASALHEFYSSLHPAIWTVRHLRRTLDAAIADGANSPWQFERVQLSGCVHFTTGIKVWPSPYGGFLWQGLVNRPALRTMDAGALVGLRSQLRRQLMREAPRRIVRRLRGLLRRTSWAGGDTGPLMGSHPDLSGLVSVIIPVHNRSALLREAVASVLDQTYRPIEIIIVNDGSNDDTAAAADLFAVQHPDTIIVLHQRNAGPGVAREAGRQIARGEFIQYLDSDDILLPRKLELQVEGLARNPGCGVAYCKTRFCERGAVAEPQPWKRTGERIEWMFPSFLQSRWWGTSTPLYRRTVTDAAGPWLDLINEEDWEYDCRVAAAGVRLCFVDEFLSEEREHSGARLSRGGSTSTAKLLARARAHQLIAGHAHRAGITDRAPEMQVFAREVFLLARQCGACGLDTESAELFALAKSCCGKARANGLDFRLYGAAASVLGWPLAGRLSCLADRLRRS